MWLRDRLAPKIDLHAVVVADDENLALAERHGFDAIERPNDRMGVKWNAGFAHAAARGADLFVLAGSDNWIHPTAFDLPPIDYVSTGRAIDFVDLDRGALQHARHEHLIPWIVPRALLEPLDFRPFPDGMQRGTETMLRGALGMPQMVERDDVPAVDFKNAESVSPYAGVRNSTGDGIEHDLSILERHYPARLVDRARSLSSKE